ncbi:MAG: hypothetical protein KAQ79_04070 [Cyclobacteriaceae bacterium]|nr:hypothetical protein [Cyclobacteriaceae bacterium]
MRHTKNTQKRDQEFSPVTFVLADFCHACEICPIANKKPNSAFEKLMKWHRKWCPAWAAHTKVYGLKSLAR